MADTQRTRAALLAIMADNVTGNITPQNLRDGFVTLMEPEFAYPGDFYKQPMPTSLTTDRTWKGWVDYSQVMLSGCSFGALLAVSPSGSWRPAAASASAYMPAMGIALNSYLSGESQAQILRKGMIYMSAWSALLSGMIGRPVYLNSGTAGSIMVTIPTIYSQIVGVVEPADIGSTGTLGGKWRFDPAWSVTGV